jgi:RNA polymerase sigma-70 factor, ECF subfamily
VHENSTSLSLLQRVRANDQEAWTRLLFLYTPLVHYWLNIWGVRGPDADDIRQEVFQAAATYLATFRRDRPGDTFRGWLRTIARRKFLDHCRRRQSEPEAPGGSDARLRLQEIPEPADPESDDPPELVHSLHHRGLELVRSQFEDRTWQVFWRCVVDGQSPSDIGQDLGITPAAVRQAKSRVLRRLKEELGDLLN